MTAPSDADRPPEPVWTAAAVARRLGIAPGTLRSWAQRHGIEPAAHAPGRHRRYTASDVAELDAIRNLVDQGVAISAAADLVRGQRRPAGRPIGAEPDRASRSAAPPADPAGAVAADLAAAAARLDPDAAADLVMARLDGDGVVVGWEALCRPAFDVLEVAVGSEAGCADSHLLLTWVLTTCLRTRPAARGAHPVLLACAAGEQHTLGTEVLRAALAERGVPARMLGPDVPVAALTHAVARLRPRAVVVWAQRALTAAPGALATLTAHSGRVLAAGPGWDRSRLPAQVTRVDSLPAALALTAFPITDRADQGLPGAVERSSPS